MQAKCREATSPRDQAFAFESGELDETIINNLSELLTSAKVELRKEAGRPLKTNCNGPVQALLLSCNDMWTKMKDQLYQDTRTFFDKHLESVVR
jgi:hypothetical protein